MNPYYLLVIVAVVMFGGCFAMQDAYRKRNGSGLVNSVQFSLLSSIVTLPVLYVLMVLATGCYFEFSLFTLVMAFFSAINGFLFSFCSFKALGKINLSLYSLFSMLGGMALPFVQGLLFYDEPLTIGKGLCFAFICVALILTLEKSEKRKGGTIYYIGIFVLNGMSGVLSKIYASAPFEKASTQGYSLWSSALTIVAAAVILLALGKKEKLPKLSWASFGIASASGVTNRIANLFLLIALSAEGVESTVQYPMVTGGVMIVSTLICFFGENKPSRKEIVSIVVAFVGTLCLFVVPV